MEVILKNKDDCPCGLDIKDNGLYFLIKPMHRDFKTEIGSYVFKINDKDKTQKKIKVIMASAIFQFTRLLLEQNIITKT